MRWRISLSIAMLGAALTAPCFGAAEYWDTNGSTAGAGGSGNASGTWDTSGHKNNWNSSPDGTGAQVPWTAGADAVFAAGTDATGSYNITLSGNPSLSSLTVEEGSPAISGGGIGSTTLDFGAVSGAPINVAAGASLTENSGTIFAGTGGLVKTGPGQLFLRGTNTFTKAGTGNQAYLTITDGVADFTSDLNLGALPASNNATAVTIDGGTLRYLGTTAYTWSNTRGITIGAGGGTIDVFNATSVTLPNQNPGIAGTGTLTKIGPGTLQLSSGQFSGFTGKYAVTGGTLGFNGQVALGASPASVRPEYITLDGGALRYTGPINGNLSANEGITIGPNGGELDADAATTLTINGVVSGNTGSKLTVGSSLFELRGVNTYGGPTQINSGADLSILNLANGGLASGLGQSSSAASNLILNGGSASFYSGSTDRNFTVTELGGNLSVGTSKGLQFTSTAAIAMTGTGSRTLGLSSCSSSGTPCTATLGLAIGNPASGSTSLYVSGGGIWTLTNPNNNYSGTTTIATGALQLGTAGTIPDGSQIQFIGTSAKLDLNGFDETVKTISGTAGAIALGSGVLRLSSPAGESFEGIISGAGRVVKMGSGALTLSGLNTYTGDTEIEAGTLQITKAYLADSADVRMTSTSIFNLTFSGTDTIDSLFIDGVSEATGTWGGLSSAAAHKSSRFSGAGMLLVSTQLPGLAGDFNNNGVVDAADYVLWRKGLGTQFTADQYTAWRNTFGATAGVPGDFDNSGVVDDRDYIVWRNNLGTNNTLPNDDGFSPIGQADYDLWRAHFGMSMGNAGGAVGAAAVPEPAGVSLLLVCAVLSAVSRRNHRSRDV